MRISLNFGRQIIVLVTILLAVPVAITVFMFNMINKSESALVEKQKVRLMRAAEQLDISLSTGFDAILKKNGATDAMPVREKVAILNAELRGLIQNVKAAYPETEEIGFYSAELDRIIDGSPAPYAGENFSRRRRSNFLTSMEGQVMAQAYGLKEGGILEIYRPLVRQGKIIGVVWATESLSKFAAQRHAIAYTSYAIIMVGVLVGFGGAIFVVHRFVQNVNQIKVGLRSLRFNLEQPLVPAAGELREITDAINELAFMLVRTQEYTKVMLATIDDGLLVVDMEGRVVIANAAISKTLGLDGKCVGQLFTQLLPNDAPFSRFLQEALQKETQMADVPVSWRCPGQGERQLLVSTAVLLSGKQRIGAVLLLRDVTEQVKLQEEMRRHERLVALGRLVMGVAHEIRNPLTSINCYLQLWQKNDLFPQQPLATMRQEVSRLDALVEKLLYFAKPAKARPVVYDINQLVETVMPFFKDVVRVSVQTELSPDLPPVLIDPEQMERVLQNIIYNAYQAMPEGGLLTVSTYQEESGDYAVIKVKDTGCGIPAENIREIFEPFFTTKPRGTGLGLALANEIVEAHGGRIEAESTVGRGTTMRVYLPVFKGEIKVGKACAGRG
ncbi:MAG: two-component system sensor histidine kinase AtoS [Firmicutes bacterium]|nr:two-component system sensor histidine kinase AtoS [Bacillota bacterium]